MKKVRTFKRKDRDGFWVSWRENGRRKTKQLNTKTEQKHFANLVYQRINSDVYTTVDLPFAEVREQYLQTYEIRGLAAASKYEAAKFLGQFFDISTPATSRSITQKMVDIFVLRRRRQVKSAYSLNSSISRMLAFLAWMKKRGYHPGGIDLVKVPVPEIIHEAIPDDDIRKLFTLAESDAWRTRILISLFTGLRKRDVDGLRLADIDLDRMTLSVVQQKTHKAAVKPIPDVAEPLLRRYIDGLDGGQERLFADRGVRRAWDRLRTAAGCYEINHDVMVTTSGRRKPQPKILWKFDRQDLRRTYATAIEKTGPMYNATDALQHSSRDVTGKHYIDRAAIDRWQVNQLPIKEWLKPWK